MEVHITSKNPDDPYVTPNMLTSLPLQAQKPAIFSVAVTWESVDRDERNELMRNLYSQIQKNLEHVSIVSSLLNHARATIVAADKLYRMHGVNEERPCSEWTAMLGLLGKSAAIGMLESKMHKLEKEHMEEQK